MRNTEGTVGIGLCLCPARPQGDGGGWKTMEEDWHGVMIEAIIPIILIVVDGARMGQEEGATLLG